MTIRNALLGCSLLTLAACGGGGSGGSTGGGSPAPLTVPSQMTIVEAQNSSPGMLRVPGTARAGGSAYETDETRLWVHDDSMEPLQIINEILCYVSQCGYDDPDVVNQGPYLALVDGERCRQGQREVTQGQQSGSASSRVEYEEWTVDSSRADASSPHVVRVWFDSTEERGEGLEIESRFYVKLVIHASPTAELPYGKFVLNFKCLPRSADPDTGTPLFKGTLATVDRGDGLAEYTFYESEGDLSATPEPGEFAMRMRARVVTGDDGTTGQAFTAMEQRYNFGEGPQEETKTYHVTYNDDYLARRRITSGAEDKVFDRNQFDTFAWRYGLYHAATGARVQVTSGFPLRDASGAHGWVGYYGMWFPEHVAIADGQTLYREQPGQTGDPTEYTAFVQVGKLHKRTKLQMTLGDIEGEDMWMWDGSGDSLVQWTQGDFFQVAVWNEQEQRMERLNQPVSITGNMQPLQWMHFWSDARGDVNFVWPETGSPTDASPVTTWQDEIIDGDSPELANGDLTLLGYFDAPRPNCTQAQAAHQNGESPFFAEVTDPTQGIQYTLRKSDLMLLHNGEPVTFAAGVDPTGTPSEHGVYSGPLVTAAPQEVWQVHDADVTYSWEYGPQEWNQLRTVKDAQGAFVAFDPPLVVEYQHDEPSNTRMHGKTFRLEYEGFGELHGLPHEEVADGQWLPLVTIPSGTIVAGDAGNYRVKILEGEQRMVEVANPATVMANQGLSFDTTLDPPVDQYADPANGTRPTVTDPPMFVGGEKQSGDAQ